VKTRSCCPHQLASVDLLYVVLYASQNDVRVTLGTAQSAIHQRFSLDSKAGESCTRSIFIILFFLLQEKNKDRPPCCLDARFQKKSFLL